METSNSSDLAADVTTEIANPVDSSAPAADITPAKTDTPLSLKDVILAQKDKPQKPEVVEESEDTPAQAADAAKPAVVPPGGAAAPEAPKYEPNFKYKAFGKEKEIPELFKGVVKDAESEKQVREVFTRAEAFDDMKLRYETSQHQSQQVLNDYTTLDRDVKRITGFLNKGDLDNFFANVRLTDGDLLKYLQNKAQYMQDPGLKMQYQEQVNQRAQYSQQQEQYQNLQTSYYDQAVQARTMQLDNILSRSDVSGAASTYDSQQGEIGAFRMLVMNEAAGYSAVNKQDLSAEQAVNLVMRKFGKFLAQPAPQAPAQQVAPAAAANQAPAPQAPNAPVVVAAKPAIPTINGKGTSPIKQAPRSLDDLKRMGREAAKSRRST
jgi:hypothetical protein